MARPTKKQARVRFEKRYETRLRETLEIPEVRDAVAKIRRDAWRLWKAREPVESPISVGETRRESSLYWLERAVCRRNRVSVRIEGRGTKRPVVHLSLTIAAEQVGLAARLRYPQDLISPSQYDLWEIRRDASLARIREDFEYQWRELHEERRLRREGKLARGAPGSGLPPRRGPSTERKHWAIVAYQQRQHGAKWREIGQAVKRHESSVRSAVKDLCKRTGLTWPEPGTALPDAPTTDCNNCPNRPSPSELCDECAWLPYIATLEARSLIPRGT